MTDTVGDAILAAINSNWNVGSGGTKPERYTKEDTQVMPDDPDFVWMLTDTADENPEPFNNDFNIITTTIDMFVSSKQDANREQRLDTLLNEIKRIINPTNVTGFKNVRVRRIRRLPSDKKYGVYAAIVTFFLKSSLVSHKVIPGSSENPTFETDELTVNDWLKVPLIKSADGTDTIELLAGEATFPNDVHMGSELKFSSAILHGASNAFHMHPASGNADILLNLHPLGTNTLSKFQLRNAASPANYGAFEFKVDGTTASINAITGGGGSPPDTLNINDADWDAINIGDVSCVTAVGGDLSVSGGDLSVRAVGIPKLQLKSTDTSLGADQSIGRVYFFGSDASADGAGTYAQIEGKTSRAPTGGFRDGYLSFSTSVGTTLSEKMRLDKNGNLSITGTFAGMTEAQLAGITGFGSGKKFLQPCIPLGGAYVDTTFTSAGGVFDFENKDGTDDNVYYQLALPTNKDGLKLYINGYTLDLEDADANDYVSNITIYGVDYDSLTSVLNDATNRTAPNSYTSNPGAVDMSGYKGVKIIVACFVTTPAELAITNFGIWCYYAA